MLALFKYLIILILTYASNVWGHNSYNNRQDNSTYAYAMHSTQYYVKNSVIFTEILEKAATEVFAKRLPNLHDLTLINKYKHPNTPPKRYQNLLIKDM